MEVNEKVGPVLTPEMLKALCRSGYLMESRVNRVLRDASWHVNANNFIPDPVTGKPRESDLVAQKLHTIDSSMRHGFSNVVVIECINNDFPVVLLSRVPDDPARVSQYFRMGGFPRSIDAAIDPHEPKNPAVDLPIWLGRDTAHRYNQLPAYDMYCTFTPRKQGQQEDRGKLRAEHPDDWHGTFQKVLQVQHYFQQMHDRTLVWSAAAGGDDPQVWITHYHHVVVFKGPLIGLNQPDRLIEGGEVGDAAERRPHLLYRRSEGNAKKVVATMVDIVVEDYMPKFLQLLDNEADHFCTMLAGNLDGLLSRLRPDATPLFQQLIAKSSESDGY